jgi:Icc protein
MRIVDPEISAVTDDSVTVCFATTDDDGRHAPYDAQIVLRPAAGRPRRVVAAPGESAVAGTGLRLVRVEGLAPSTVYEVEIRGTKSAADVSADPDALFYPAEVRTLRRPPGEVLARVATVSDLHFGEEVCGLGPTGDESPVFRAADENPPYWQYMNEAVVDDINATGVDAVVMKGDLTGEGRADEFAAARATFDRLKAPWHAVLGNHDAMTPGVDGLGLLGQPADPAWAVDVPGCRLVLVDTVDPGKDGGTLPPERVEALRAVLSPGDTPALVFGHHYVSDPRKRIKRSFGINRRHSADLLTVLADHPRVGGYFAGHTHRNRVRFFDVTGRMPSAEVCATKDYPGAWALYRIHEGGYMQEVRRCPAPAALRWAHRTKDMYWGLYRTYAIGSLADRCFTYLW